MNQQLLAVVSAPGGGVPTVQDVENAIGNVASKGRYDGVIYTLPTRDSVFKLIFELDALGYVARRTGLRLIVTWPYGLSPHATYVAKRDREGREESRRIGRGY